MPAFAAGGRRRAVRIYMEKNMSRSIVRAACLLLMLLPLGAAAQQSRGASRIVEDTVRSSVLDTVRRFNVLLPASYGHDTARTYPVLYLLHGMGEDHSCWALKGRLKDVYDRLAASGAIDEMIIVTPDAGGADVKHHWQGYFDVPGWAYETFFFSEFMPRVEQRYRCGGAKERRAVAGLSMGGGGSVVYALHRPEDFCAVYAMSAMLHHDGVKQPASRLDLALEGYHRNSALDYMRQDGEDRRAPLRAVAWFVDCGDDDFLLRDNLAFYGLMRRAAVPCELRVRDGGHDWEYWHSALFRALPFVSRAFWRAQAK